MNARSMVRLRADGAEWLLDVDGALWGRAWPDGRKWVWAADGAGGTGTEHQCLAALSRYAHERRTSGA